MKYVSAALQRDFNYPLRCNNKIINCWIASTPPSLSLGLMNYQLPKGCGCLLVYPPGENLGLWMKNCLHSLVALFLDDQGSVLQKTYMDNQQPNVIHRGPSGCCMALEILPEESVFFEVGDYFEGAE